MKIMKEVINKRKFIHKNNDAYVGGIMFCK